jgi:GNAT superfamily N-acetyltransferase
MRRSEMRTYEFPPSADVEQAYRAAHRALEGIAAKDSFVPEKDLTTLAEVIRQFQPLVRQADIAVAAQFGPLVTWEAPSQVTNWEPVMSSADLDHGTVNFGQVRLSPDAARGPDGRWQDSAFDHAGLAYKRTCGWDFTPGEAGIWLVMLAPVSGTGSETGPWHYTGHLTGFVIIYDRDGDGAYESVGHMWTATTSRRKGIAQRLLAEARSRFPLRGIERPYTDDGTAFIAACAPDLS